MPSNTPIPVAVGSAASAEIVSIKLDEAAELTGRLKRLLTDIQRQIELTEKHPEEKNGKLSALEGTIRLVSTNITLEASVWSSNARARSRKA